MLPSINSSAILRASILLLGIVPTSAYINHDQAWQFSCAAAGESSKVTLITRLDTDEPGITTYDVRASIIWGDQFSDGDRYTLDVGKTHKITFEYAFESEGGQEEVTMKYRRLEIPAESTMLGQAYAAIGSQRKEVVTVTKDECIVRGEDAEDREGGEALSSTKSEGGDASSAPSNFSSILQYSVMVSMAVWSVM